MAKLLTVRLLEFQSILILLIALHASTALAQSEGSTPFSPGFGHKGLTVPLSEEERISNWHKDVYVTAVSSGAKKGYEGLMEKYGWDEATAKQQFRNTVEYYIKDAAEKENSAWHADAAVKTLEVGEVLARTMFHISTYAEPMTVSARIAYYGACAVTTMKAGMLAIEYRADLEGRVMTPKEKHNYDMTKWRITQSDFAMSLQTAFGQPNIADIISMHLSYDSTRNSKLPPPLEYDSSGNYTDMEEPFTLNPIDNPVRTPKDVSWTESITVSAKGEKISSTHVLEKGKEYILLASGTFQYDEGEAGTRADALHEENDNHVFTPRRFLSINGQLTGDPKKVGDHSYRFTLNGNGKPVTFRIEDAGYDDNKGSLTVRLTYIAFQS